MSSKTDEQLMEELRKLPDIQMSHDSKQKIVSTIRSKEALNMEQTVHPRRFGYFGKGLAICSVLAATVWMGTSLIQTNQPATLPGISNGASPTPSAPNPVPSSQNGVVTPTPTAPATPQGEELLNTIRKRAEKGAVINSTYTVETTVFDDVEKAWGHQTALSMQMGSHTLPTKNTVWRSATTKACKSWKSVRSTRESSS